MDTITLKDYRCFHNEQTARLAPLTLLVGENSTGKTSFLAMLRALSDITRGLGVPDFKEDPYDLGSFHEIAHYRGARGGQSHTFEAGFTSTALYLTPSAGMNEQATFNVTFGKRGTTPDIERIQIAIGDNSIDGRSKVGQPSALKVKTVRGSWERKIPAEEDSIFDLGDDPIFSLYYYLAPLILGDVEENVNFTPLHGSPDFSLEDREQLLSLTSFSRRSHRERPYASAPVRSKPRRTYDPSRPTRNPEGDYIPMYLADMFWQDKQAWNALKERLEGFGKDAGLFDEISIKQLSKRAS